MPYRMLAFPFMCSQPGCERRQLSYCGLYKTVRHFIDHVDYYYHGDGKCHMKVAARSREILDQLDPCNRRQFPAVLSYHLPLDRRVVAELLHRSLGNSSTRVHRKLKELHSTAQTTWTECCSGYTSSCNISAAKTLSFC